MTVYDASLPMQTSKQYFTQALTPLRPDRERSRGAANIDADLRYGEKWKENNMSSAEHRDAATYLAL